jgi:membrane associated rhomboid family serine protease
MSRSELFDVTILEVIVFLLCLIFLFNRLLNVIAFQFDSNDPWTLETVTSALFCHFSHFSLWHWLWAMYSVWSIHVPLYDEIGGLKYFQFLVLTCITLSLAKLFVFHRIPWMHGMDYSCTFMLLLVRFDISSTGRAPKNTVFGFRPEFPLNV